MSSYSNHGQPNHGQSDEVDLREVFASIGRFFASIGKGIVKFILVLRKVTVKFLVLILALLVLGGVAGFFLYQKGEQYYRAQMVIDSKFYSFELMESVINSLDEQARVNAYRSLSAELGMAEEEVSKLRGISIEPLMPVEERTQMLSYMRMIRERAGAFTEEQMDSIQNRLMMNASQFFITAEVYNNAILNDLEKGLVLHLASKEYVTRRAKVEKENLQMLKSSIEEDEQKLARLKSSIAENYSENMRSGPNNLFLGTDGDRATKNIFEQSVDLYTKKARINRDLLLNREVEIVSSFTPLERPANESVIEMIIIWALIGVGAAYLIILLIGINKALNRFEEREKTEKQAV